MGNAVAEADADADDAEGVEVGTSMLFVFRSISTGSTRFDILSGFLGSSVL